MSDPSLQRVKLWRKDLVQFATDVFNFQPTNQQKEIMCSLVLPNSRTAVKSGHG